MRKLIALLLISFFAQASLAWSGIIQHIGIGKPTPPVKITFSRNNGASWQTKELKAGQSFSVPKDTTHLQINKIPYNPQNNYKVKDGNVY